MDFILTKPVIYFYGDHLDPLLQKLHIFEGGLQIYFHLSKEWTMRKLPNTKCGVFKKQWINKVKNFPPITVFVQDLSDISKFENLVTNYNILRQQCNFSKNFQSKIIMILVGKNIHSYDFTLIKKDIDFKKVIIIELETIGTILKRYFYNNKRLKKMIQDDYIVFYEDLYAKYRNDSQKLQKNDVSDKRLILEIKKTLLSEILQNQKRAEKHLKEAYQSSRDLIDIRKTALIIDDDQQLFLSYELILQAEEYREISDQLLMKQLLNTTKEINEISNMFDNHYRGIKNLVQNKHFQIQEYLWRVKLFYKYLVQMEQKLSQMNPSMMFNLFQCTFLNYLHLLQLSEHKKIIQSPFEIVQVPQEYIGRANYIILEEGQEKEIRTDEKSEIYKFIIDHRSLEVESVPEVAQLYVLWDKFHEQDPQYQYTKTIMQYIKAFITNQFEVRQYLTQQLIKFGLWDEFKNMTQKELQYAQSVKQQISLNFELLLDDQNRIYDILELSKQLTQQFQFTIPSNKVVEIQAKQNKFDKILTFQLKIKLNKPIVDLLDDGYIESNSCTIPFKITSDTITIQTDKLIKNPIVKMIARIQNLVFTFLCDNVEIYVNDTQIEQLEIINRNLAEIKLLKTTGYVREENEIPFELTFEEDLELINYNEDPTELFRFKDFKGNKQKCRSGILIVSNQQENNKLFQFRVGDQLQSLGVLFQFPFEYQLKFKQLDTIYKNSVNRNRSSLCTFSKCALQLQAQTKFLSVRFDPLVQDIKFENVNSQNVFFISGEKSHYKNFGVFYVQYQRGEQIYNTQIQVNNVQVIDYSYQIELVSPPICYISKPFEIEININSQDDMIFINLRDELKKQFFVMGMTKQFVNKNNKIKYTLFPIEPGRCPLPGFIVELRMPGGPSQLIFDSQGLKSILVLP